MTEANLNSNGKLRGDVLARLVDKIDGQNASRQGSVATGTGRKQRPSTLGSSDDFPAVLPVFHHQTHADWSRVCQTGANLREVPAPTARTNIVVDSSVFPSSPVLISTPHILHTRPPSCRSEWPPRALRPASCSAAPWPPPSSRARVPSLAVLKQSAPPAPFSRPTRHRPSKSPPRMPTARSRPSTSTDGTPMLPARSPRCRATNSTSTRPAP